MEEKGRHQGNSPLTIIVINGDSGGIRQEGDYKIEATVDCQTGREPLQGILDLRVIVDGDGDRICGLTARECQQSVGNTDIVIRSCGESWTVLLK